MADLSPFSLEGRTALVTGAGSGIGQAIALGLARAGAEIFAVGHTSIDDTRAKFQEMGGRHLAATADLSREEEIERIVKRALEAWGKIDILVNVAGVIRRSPAEEHPLTDWDAVLNLNLRSVFLLCQHVGHHMLARSYGKIINIASMLTFMGGYTVVSYAAAKSGIAGLTRTLANEWAGRGINVNAIAPGWIETKMTQAIQENRERYHFILSRIPAGRWGKPEDLVGAAVFLASSAADYVNGHILVVDGGYLARG
ncbi:2-dehydro-3-deoxy-D-gluconate 5-dehydrogenase KduD [Moorella sp. E306M]|jgi:2-deoxy-D-gluconate 3-dehydrogenase|uniref:2-dehydro-3-deoxy-D-gluconate 5-dehydrogenase KduD n=1 Tax=Moorella sp. E306M TaxID=2572683 RepID=UPI0010FFAC3E|nr:2-dehydro-3-deoxy-D-gluconate 5-dehydrogenase KduD [Moorella sp. E306M]GEA19215.1 2-deoxy-D-gluconate 3-dehydrogenase [Moorella sp. E306M]